MGENIEYDGKTFKIVDPKDKPAVDQDVIKPAPAFGPGPRHPGRNRVKLRGGTTKIPEAPGRQK